MRRLLDVPIIHSPADLGSAAGALAQRSAALAGDRRWLFHRETNARSWEGIGAFLLSLDARLLRIYQDGLAAEGEAGRRVVQEAAGRGSENYRLVLDLLDRGALLRRTEDPLLLWQEREMVRRSLQHGESSQGQQGDRREGERLLRERDQAIAQAISATLQEGELGVLFLGAYHDVAPHLAGDITVEMVKDRGVVRAYWEELLGGQDDRRLEELAQHLTAPVRAPPLG